MPDLFPQTVGEFTYARNALEQAHQEMNGRTEDLLQAIRAYIRRCQDNQRKGKLSTIHKHIMAQWRNPDWARMPKFNSLTGKIELGSTKSELRNQKIACFGTTRADEHRRLLFEVA